MGQKLPDGSWKSSRSGHVYGPNATIGEIQDGGDWDEFRAEELLPTLGGGGPFGNETATTPITTFQYLYPSEQSGRMFTGATEAGNRAYLPTAQGDQSRAQQQQLIQMLMEQAQGKGPSVAQEQLRQATDRNISSAMAMSASQQGPGAAAGAYNAANMSAQANQQAAGDSAILRLQEQLQARGMLGSVLGQTRGGDLQQQQQAVQQRQLNDELVKFYIAQGNTIDEANRRAAMDAEQMRVQGAQYNTQAALDRAKFGYQMGKDVVGAFGSGLAAGQSGGKGGQSMSDERVKEDIKPGDSKLYSFLDSLDSHDYKYKNEKHGKGRRVSVMAQELEKSDLGEEFVFETRDGKAVDYGKGLGTMLAAQAALHKRLKKLEGES